MTKRYVGIALGATLLLIAGFIMPLPEGMTLEGRRVLGIILFALCVWVFDSFPIGIGSCLAMALIPVLKVLPFDTTLQQFMRPATFFIVSSYAITCSLAFTPLSKRLLRTIFRIVRPSGPNAAVLAIMATTALISTIVSNVPVTAMMMTVAFAIFTGMGINLIGNAGANRRGLFRKKAGAAGGEAGGAAGDPANGAAANEGVGYNGGGMARALMIGIPFAAMCGGIATPAGSSVNVIAIDLLKKTSGVSMTFLEWMKFGVPCAVLLLPLSWFIVTRLFKPEPIPPEVLDKLINPADIPKKFEPREIRALVIISLTVALWISGSWIDGLDMTLVAALSMIAFFLPGVKVFTWEEFSGSISWDAIFTVGSVMALGAAVTGSGLSSWLVGSLFAGASSWPVLLMLLTLAFAVNFIHLVLPTAPAIVTILLPPVLAAATGCSPAAITAITAMMAGCVMLLPVDTLTILTYSKKHYTIAELFKAGIANSCVWAAVIAFWAFIVG